MIQKIRKHQLGIAIGSSGWALLIFYLAYAYAEYGGIYGIVADFHRTDPFIMLFHTMILSAPLATMILGHLTEKKVELQQELKKTNQQLQKNIGERKKAEEELKKYSEELEQSNKLKDLFIDIMRHDLLNPAGVVKGMAKIALEDEKDLDKKEYLQLIVESNERVIELIENASILAKLESGEELEFKERDLSIILRSIVKEMASLADEKKTKIKINAEGEFPSIINPLIIAVFSNLISNAIKYGPNDSEVVVGIEKDGPNWKISVADKGEGVLDEDKKVVFDRFKRVQKGPVKGTGLGLAIVKKVVELHKGKVWVEDNPGGGSIFFVTLPKH